MLGPTLLKKKVISGKVEWVLFILLDKIRWKNSGPTENYIDTHFKWKWNSREKQNNFQLKTNVLFQLKSKWEFILKVSIQRHFKLSLQIASVTWISDLFSSEKIQMFWLFFSLFDMNLQRSHHWVTLFTHVWLKFLVKVNFSSDKRLSAPLKSPSALGNFRTHAVLGVSESAHILPLSAE